MKVNTKDWFDGVRLCKKGDVYLGAQKKGFFKVVEGEEAEDIKEMPMRLAIKKALLGMDPADDKIWTNTGLPAMKVVEKLIGQNITREQVEDAFPNFRRDVAPLKSEKTLTPSEA